MSATTTRQTLTHLPWSDPGVRYVPAGRAFGLDISNGSLKAVEISRDARGVVIEAHSRLTIDPDVVLPGGILKPQELAPAIRKLLAMAVPQPITLRYVIVSLGEANVYIHPFELPSTLSETQVRRAVPFEAEGELPIALQDMYADLQFHRSRTDAHHVLFAAAPRRIVDVYVRVLQEAGLTPLAIEMESLALARCLIPLEDEPVLLLDAGERSSTITAIERGMIHGAVSVPFGGATLTDVLAAELNISREEAEKLKRAEGLLGKSSRLRRALEGALAALVDDVQRAATYHQTHTGRPVQQLLLAGGTALLPGIREFFTSRVPFAVTVGDVFASGGVTFSPRYSDERRGALTREMIFYATSVGLAMRGVAPDSVTEDINFLPLAITRRYRDWWKHLVLAVLSSVSVAVLLLLLGAFGLWALTLREERVLLAARVRDFEMSLPASSFMANLRMAAEVNAEITVLKQFADRRMDVGSILAELRVLLPTTTSLTSVVVTEPVDARQGTIVQLEGIAARREDILAFMRGVKERPDVSAVDAPITNLDRALEAPFRITLILKPRTPIVSGDIGSSAPESATVPPAADTGTQNGSQEDDI